MSRALALCRRRPPGCCRLRARCSCQITVACGAAADRATLQVLDQRVCGWLPMGRRRRLAGAPCASARLERVGFSRRGSEGLKVRAHLVDTRLPRSEFSRTTCEPYAGRKGSPGPWPEGRPWTPFGNVGPGVLVSPGVGVGTPAWTGVAPYLWWCLGSSVWHVFRLEREYLLAVGEPWPTDDHRLDELRCSAERSGLRPGCIRSPAIAIAGARTPVGARRVNGGTPSTTRMPRRPPPLSSPLPLAWPGRPEGRGSPLLTARSRLLQLDGFGASVDELTAGTRPAIIASMAGSPQDRRRDRPLQDRAWLRPRPLPLGR